MQKNVVRQLAGAPSLGNRIARVLATALLAAALFAAGCFYRYSEIRQERHAEAERDAREALRSFEAYTERMFDYADGYLRAVRAFYLRHGAGEPLRRFFDEIKTPHSQRYFGTVAVIDRQGRVVFRSDGTAGAPVADQALGESYWRGHDRDELQIGPTRRDATDGSLDFHIARRIERDGAFDGEIVLTMSPKDLIRLFEEFRLGRHGSAAMWTIEPKLIARRSQLPSEDESYDRIFPMVKQHLELGRGEIHAPNAVDGVTRHLAFKRLDTYPLYISVGLADGDIEDSLSETRTYLSQIAAAFAVLAALVSVLVLRQLRHNHDLMLNSRRSAALLDLPKRARLLDDPDFLQYGIGLAEDLTDSAIAFLHFVGEDGQSVDLATWSKATLNGYCQAAFDRHYPLAQAGIWADALRQRAPVVVNDYAEAPGRRGLPDGHSPLTRFISVPVVDADKVVMILGVGNKKSPYTDIDVESVSLIGSAIWRIARYRRSEAALLESESRLRSLISSINDAIITCDHVGAITFWNPGAEHIFGYRAEDVLGTPIERLVPERFRDRHGRGFAAALNGDFGARHTIETFALTSGQREVPVELTPSGWTEGGTWNFTAIIRDISERRRVEAELDGFEAKLRESQKMEALGTLAGGVAHGFNNILSAIVGNAWLARQDIGPEHPARESLDEIGKAADRAKDLVRQVLTFGRRHVLDVKVVDLEPVVREAVKMMRATLPAGVALHFDCAADTPPVRADASQIDHVLLNLCTNAWHAIQGRDHPGEIVVALASAARDGRRFALLSVRDNGGGMDDATRVRIFEPFFTTKPVGQGTGLGMAVVHGIVKEHEASIEVSSAPGEGTTIAIYFPAAPEAAAAAELPPPGPDTPPLGTDGKRLLFVDDDQSIVLLMKRGLERQGFHVDAHSDAGEALAALRADPVGFDLVVTDYNMPEMSGLEVAAAVKLIRPDLPVVMASGYITQDLKDKAEAAGIADLIYKPSTIEQMCEAVARILAGR